MRSCKGKLVRVIKALLIGEGKLGLEHSENNFSQCKKKSHRKKICKNSGNRILNKSF